MNYKTMLKGALALSLSLIVGEASAYTATTNSVPAYGEDFEAKTVDAAISTYSALDAGDNNAPYGWLAPEGDESKIIAGGPTGSTKALQLNTDAGTLTNQFQKSVRDSLNAGIADAGAYFETEVKFVPSDTLDAGIAGGQDATKFAIYAYADEDNNTTNLVVFHKYFDAVKDDYDYTNEQFGAVNCDVYTKLRVEMKQIVDQSSFEAINVFSVKVNDGAALTSQTAVEGGIWFLTAENDDNDNNKLVSSLNFKGTGEIDNIAAGTISIAESYTVNFVDEDGTTSLFSTNVAKNAGVYYLGAEPTKAATVASNFTFAAWSPAFAAGDPASADATYTATYTATVRSYTITWTIDGVDETTTVAYGEVPTHAAPEKQGYTFTGWTPEPSAVNGEATYVATFEEQQGSDDYEAGNTVDGVTISAGMATWLNGLKTAKNLTKTQLEAAFANDQDIYTLTEEYLLNTDPTVTTTVAFSISSIAVGNTVDLNVALTRTENNAAVTTAINGTLKIYGAETVDGTYTVDQELTDKFNGGTPATKSFTTSNKFFKAVIE